MNYGTKIALNNSVQLEKAVDHLHEEYLCEDKECNYAHEEHYHIKSGCKACLQEASEIIGKALRSLNE